MTLYGSRVSKVWETAPRRYGYGQQYGGYGQTYSGYGDLGSGIPSITGIPCAGAASVWQGVVR